jgi:putative intracellular protease/amidase
MLKPVSVPSTCPENTRVIGFLLVPRFSMIAFTSAIEPLRLANRVSGRTLYEWRLFSGDGRPIRASNEVEISVGGSYADARGLHTAIVCAGLDVQTFNHRDLMASLRRLSSFGAAIGAVCTGTYVLAKAGLLDGYQSTIHWENHSGLISEFPHLDVSQELFEIDRNRLTCAGGTAAVDMMLSVITKDHGPEIASLVTDQLIHHRIREAGERQRMDLRARLGVAHPKASIRSRVDGEDDREPSELCRTRSGSEMFDPAAREAFLQVSRAFTDQTLLDDSSRIRTIPAEADQHPDPLGRHGLRIPLRVTLLEELQRAFRPHTQCGTAQNRLLGNVRRFHRRGRRVKSSHLTILVPRRGTRAVECGPAGVWEKPWPFASLPMSRAVIRPPDAPSRRKVIARRVRRPRRRGER